MTRGTKRANEETRKNIKICFFFQNAWPQSRGHLRFKVALDVGRYGSMFVVENENEGKGNSQGIMCSETHQQHTSARHFLIESVVVLSSAVMAMSVPY